MKGVSVMLPGIVEGRELQNTITEVAQGILGEIVIKGEAQQGYIPDSISPAVRKVFIGSKISMTFPVTLVSQTKKLFGGYNTKKEEHNFQIRINTPLGDDYHYNVLELCIYIWQHFGNGSSDWFIINIDEEKYASVKNVFEGFIVALYKKLAPAAKPDAKMDAKLDAKTDLGQIDQRLNFLKNKIAEE